MTTTQHHKDKSFHFEDSLWRTRLLVILQIFFLTCIVMFRDLLDGSIVGPIALLLGIIYLSPLFRLALSKSILSISQIGKALLQQKVLLIFFIVVVLATKNFSLGWWYLAGLLAGLIGGIFIVLRRSRSN